ncbi:MAG: hypothetical protein M0P71_01605 [Melioribacteraceae bacterium]|nr:hypothetical protein [Melioribacteraceae bacterium]
MNTLRNTNEEVIDLKKEEYKKNIKRMKANVKLVSNNIKEMKEELKTKQKKGDYKSWSLMSDLNSYKNDVRNTHIAYAMAKGRVYQKIESKVRDNNEPNWWAIKANIENFFGKKFEIVDFKVNFL